jgi:hypothetical protein
MPKINGTKKQKALELRDMILQGPSTINDVQFTPGRLYCSGDTPRKQYDLWVRSWILPRINELIPELKKLEKEK